MSQRKPTDGASRSDLQTVSRALREIARETDRVTLTELVRVTSLDSATVETVMGTIEGRNPMPATRIEMPDSTIAWKLAL